MGVRWTLLLFAAGATAVDHVFYWDSNDPANPNGPADPANPAVKDVYFDDTIAFDYITASPIDGLSHDVVLVKDAVSYVSVAASRA